MTSDVYIEIERSKMTCYTRHRNTEGTVFRLIQNKINKRGGNTGASTRLINIQILFNRQRNASPVCDMYRYNLPFCCIPHFPCVRASCVCWDGSNWWTWPRTSCTQRTCFSDVLWGGARLVPSHSRTRLGECQSALNQNIIWGECQSALNQNIIWGSVSQL